ncbi:MAG: hypothetical protein RIF33_07145 [Cyclobacteriaceae bacterium]
MRLVIVLLVLVPFCLSAQDAPKLQVNGYIKDMVTWTINKDAPNYFDNLVHNRLNLHWYPSESLTGKLEFRNRLIVGDLATEFYPFYSSFIDVNNDYFDLSWTPIDEKGVLFHTMIDRAFLRFNKNNWEVTAGRQRINWGKNLVWNPNDIFNAYSFFDFDYEERPGSDAIRIKRFTGYASEIEFAFNVAESWREVTTALRYQMSAGSYDIQFFGGVMKNNLTVGTGWAGNLGNAGFKGEVTYFEPLEDGYGASQLLASISVDYSFVSSFYLNGGFLYNSEGSSNPPSIIDPGAVNSNIDVRELSPYVLSTFIQGSYQFTPLISGGVATIFYPSDQSVFVNPFITYSLKENLDFDFTGQLFFADNDEGDYTSAGSAIYARIKWSF